MSLSAVHNVLALSILGTEKEHTVFEGECIGQILGMELIRRELGIRTATVGTDNQAGMQALMNPGPGTGRYLVDQVIAGIEKITRTRGERQIRIYWTPAHEGIPGNERADREAKRAAEGKETRGIGIGGLAGPLPVSKAAIVRRQKKMLKKEANDVFTKSPRYERMKAIDPNLPSRKFYQTAKGLPRKHAALLFQLRTGHCPLNAYLFRFKKIESAQCQACQQGDETVKHFLLECTAYRRHRAKMYEVVRPGPKAMQTLLSDPKAVRVLFIYITDTKRFEEALGDMLLHNETRKERK
ncbi:hypothetical protein D9615_008936 [Tricholomella constricta]|uniref:RNase H type-1 domain-containing protein n=1 Tax=Tricholomella constricta TaxID=117010 RepID=A0A8H5H0T4_9AGAR|nr:hypothetical protein D9615_008936 [Tricholomella constricta]